MGGLAIGCPPQNGSASQSNRRGRKRRQTRLESSIALTAVISHAPSEDSSGRSRDVRHSSSRTRPPVGCARGGGTSGRESGRGAPRGRGRNRTTTGLFRSRSVLEVLVLEDITRTLSQPSCRPSETRIRYRGATFAANVWVTI